MFSELLMEKLCKEIKDRFFKLNLTYICIMYIQIRDKNDLTWIVVYVYIFFTALYQEFFQEMGCSVTILFFLNTPTRRETFFFDHITIFVGSLQILVHLINCVKNLLKDVNA